MKEYDKLYLKIYNIEKADVYVSKGKGYKWINHLDSMAFEDDVFTTSAGWQFYVVGVSNDIFKGTFGMKIWVEQNNPPAVVVPSTTPTTTTTTTPVIIDKNVVADVKDKETDKTVNVITEDKTNKTTTVVTSGGSTIIADPKDVQAIIDDTAKKY